MSSIIKVNTVQDVDGNNIINENADTITIGASGDTINIPSGATITNNGTQTGFGREGSVDWQTGSIKTTTFTAASGEGYFINSGSALTMNLPAGSPGAIVAVSDYARNFATYNFTISPNGSEKIGGVADNVTLDVDGQAATFVYVDGTKGWINVQNAEDTKQGTSTYTADFLVVAAGASGGAAKGGGGGAGGYRASFNSEASGGGGSSETALQLTPGTVYTVTVGNGGAAVSPSPSATGTNGGDSSISGSGITTITSTGGGGGGGDLSPSGPGNAGGCGGGAGGNGPNPVSGGAGTSNQGFAGGDGYAGSAAAGGGGGGAGAVGSTVPGNSQPGGTGGAGVASTITGSSVTRGGGGGGINESGSVADGPGGAGGGGAGNTGGGVAGTANTGGGGGATHNSGTSGAGGSGVVIISVPDANYSGTTSGSPTVATGVSGKTVMTFNGDGSYTA